MTDSAAELTAKSPEVCFFAENRWRQGLFLTTLVLCLNLVGNGKVGLWDRDEPRYAGAVREMRAAGEWIVPRFNDEPRYHKPILIYWLMGIGTALAGDNPFAARLVSSLAGVATVLVVWLLARRLIGANWGFLAALMYATAPIVVAEAKLSTTDATLSFFLVTAQACIWGLSRRASKPLAALFWVAISLATLTKGPVGILLIAAAGLASWAFGGPVLGLRRLGWKWGVPLFLALTLPWYLAVGLRTNWDFFRFAWGDQVVKRVSVKMEEHGGFPGYYPVFTLLTFYPWSALVPAALLAAWSRRKAAPELGFLMGWAIGPLVVLELFKTKMIHYYLPALPALAILTAWFLAQVSTGDALTIRRWRLGGLAISLLGGVGLTMAIGLLASLALLPAEMRWSISLMVLALVVGTFYALLKFHQGATVSASKTLVATWSMVMVLMGGWVVPSAEPFRLSRIVGERLGELASEHDAKPVLVTYQEPGIIYALKRSAPTLRNWNAVSQYLQSNRALIAPMFPDQVASISNDRRFVVEVVDRIEGFNLNKGQSHALSFVRIRNRPALVARKGSNKEPLIQ